MTSTFNAAKADDNIVDDKDFPSLTQAFNMARGIKTTTTTKGVDKPKVKRASKAAGLIHDDLPAFGGFDGLADVDNDVNQDDSDDDEDPEVIRMAFEVVPAPPPMEPLLELKENGDLPGIVANLKRN